MRCDEIKKMKLNVLLSMFATIKHTYKSKLLSVCFYSHVLQLIIKVQSQCRISHLTDQLFFYVLYKYGRICFFSKEFAEKGGVR